VGLRPRSRGQRGLTAAFEIVQGHDDERAAIGAGTYATAGERYLRRLGAAIARMSLPDLLAAHPDHPGRGPIDRWVASLHDDEVLDRMSNIQPVRTEAAALSTLRLFDGMLAEVRALEAEANDGD